MKRIEASTDPDSSYAVLAQTLRPHQCWMSLRGLLQFPFPTLSHSRRQRKEPEEFRGESNKISTLCIFWIAIIPHLGEHDNFS